MLTLNTYLHRFVQNCYKIYINIDFIILGVAVWIKLQLPFSYYYGNLCMERKNPQHLMMLGIFALTRFTNWMHVFLLSQPFDVST